MVTFVTTTENVGCKTKVVFVNCNWSILFPTSRYMYSVGTVHVIHVAERHIINGSACRSHSHTRLLYAIGCNCNVQIIYFKTVVKIISDALCSSLSDAVRIGAQDKAVELIKKLANEKLPLSIKLKNPVLVTMDSGGDTIK